MVLIDAERIVKISSEEKKVIDTYVDTLYKKIDSD
jgi:hypothetical protein